MLTDQSFDGFFLLSRLRVGGPDGPGGQCKVFASYEGAAHMPSKDRSPVIATAVAPAAMLTEALIERAL